jgi:hypothetical protein
MSAKSPFRTVDWDRIPDYVAKAHRLRSAVARQAFGRALSGLAGLARRLLAPGRGRRPLPSGRPAPSSL